MTDADERTKVFADLKSELFKRQLSNSENFDKAVLAYSTGALGFSLAFLKDFVPITEAAHAWLLYASWALFVLSVISTISSFLTSQLGIARQLKINEVYYLEGKDDALKSRNSFALITEGLNYLSGIAFVLGIVFTTLFVAANLGRATTMAEEKKVPLREGAPVPKVQKIPQSDVQRGAPVPGVQKVPQQQPSQGTGTGTGSGSGSGAGTGAGTGTPPGSKEGNS